LILRKIIQIVATRCHILRLKTTKFDFGCGPVTDLAGIAYSALSGPLAGFKRPYFEGEGKTKKKEKDKKGRRRGSKEGEESETAS